MLFDEIVELITLIDKSQISLMELDYENIHLKLDKSLNRSGVSDVQREVLNQGVDNTTSYVQKKSKECLNDNSLSLDDITTKIDSEKEEQDIEYITSPMVGTVYLAPSPEKPPYIEKGQELKVGDVVCIVEAMKLMNEIESEFSGSVLEVMVENGKMVEYGQKMFKIKKP